MTKEILIVDDEPNVVMPLQFLMEQQGYKVMIAERGEDALDLRGQLPCPRSIRARVFQPYRNMIRVRINQPAFHPGSATQVHHLDDRVLTIQRTCQNQSLFALTNLSVERHHAV